MKFIYKLERKYGKLAIPNLIMYLIGINMLTYIISNYENGAYLIYKYLSLDPALVIQGEIWRIVSFVFIPPNENMIFIIFVFYIMYFLGSQLENEWGSFKFNIYYFSGILFTTLSVLSFYFFVTNTYSMSIDAVYLNMTLFLAFATLFPNHQFLIFFVIPVKVKYLAYIDGVFLIYSLITGSIFDKFIIIGSFANYLLFFGKDLYFIVSNKTSYNIRKANYVNQTLPHVKFVYKCSVCQITKKDYPNITFRYCSKCDGNIAYCQEHLNNHNHIKNN